MPSNSGKCFLFIDSDPTVVDGRGLSKAKSHAALATHRLKANLLRAEKQRQKCSTPSTPGLPHSPASIALNADKSLSRLDQPPSETQAPVQGISTFSRWRLQGARKKSALARRKDPSEASDLTDILSHTEGVELLPFLYKGNCDPFNSAGVPVTAHQFSLIKLSRSESVSTVWASELSMRPRNNGLMNDLCQSLGNLCNDPAVVHANLALGYITKAACQGKFEAGDFLAIKRQKGQALSSLRQLVERQSESGSQDKLSAIKDATQLLGACEVFLGDSKTALIHSSATARVIDIMGGFQSLPLLEIELYVHAIVGLASKMNTRPIIPTEAWDPGPWHSFCAKDRSRKFQLWSESSSVPSSFESSPQSSSWASDIDDLGASHAHTPASPDVSDEPQLLRPTTVSPQLSNILEELRELLTIEEIKIRSTPVADIIAREDIIQMFRWSHLRTTAIRGRGLHHWCDLLESNITNQSLDSEAATPTTTTYTTFDMCLCLAMRLLDRCIFHEPYLKTGMFRQTKAYYDILLDSIEKLRPAFDVRQGLRDARSYDMLWIYSVGAHTETAFLQGKVHQSGGVHCYSYFRDCFTLLAPSLSFKDFRQVTDFLEENYLYCSRLQNFTLYNLVDFGQSL
ncbi:uncharacterized protein A1O9_04071 [Exophiala aquamarina CBS 119918]|uniref:Uncharacterized protein n=1 Tax=Exophiala aquamarina CBS 119918 TaxID=1182545 RepID=A0A072PHK5_9EURO|nr:uncharacterized protein A1O9_04071 [Exophiala aquamarina CBS 119918]KEF59227.1 hypothetical protein A1O9_04071 [Exophiala aquamarina CBS 119918]